MSPITAAFQVFYEELWAWAKAGGYAAFLKPEKGFRRVEC
jgi:hypothetical protein